MSSISTPEPGEPAVHHPQPTSEPRTYASGPPPGSWQQPYQQQGHVPYAGRGQAVHPQPGYGQPHAYGRAQPMSDGDQRMWATLTHISIPLFGFVGPLITYLVLRDRSPWLKEHLTEALNFSVLVSVSSFVASFLTLLVIGWMLLPLIWVGALVLCILAAVAASRGEAYAYPLNWRLVSS